MGKERREVAVVELGAAGAPVLHCSVAMVAVLAAEVEEEAAVYLVVCR